MKKLPLLLAVAAVVLTSAGLLAHIAQAIFQQQICDQDTCAPRGDVSGNYNYTPQDSVTIHVECLSSKTLGLFGGGQKHCTSGGMVRGQAYQLSVVSTAVDPSSDQNAWITGCAQSSMVWGDPNGQCWSTRRWPSGGDMPLHSIDENGGNIYKTWRYFVLDILVKATNLNANWQGSTLYGDGRVAQIKDLSVSGNTITGLVYAVKNAVLKVDGNQVAGGDFAPFYKFQTLNSNFDTSQPATFELTASGPNDQGVYSTISKTLTWPPPGQKYSCQNNACVVDANGQYNSLSSCSAAGCGGTGANSPPGNFTLNPPGCFGGGNPSVNLSWSQSASAATYDVYRCKGASCSGLTKVAGGLTGTSYTDTGPSKDTDYYYTVTAVNNLGSKDSNQVFINTAPQNCTGGGGRNKCVNNSCVFDPADSGPNQCSPVGSACTTGLGRNKCVNNSCVFDPTDSGPNQCSPVGSSCTGTGGRNKCVNNSCVFDPADSGPNQCATNADCVAGPQTHTVCQSGACVSVPGGGANQCSVSSDCPQPAPTCSYFTAAPTRLIVPPPAQSTLSWSCTDVSNCSINQGVGSVSAQGTAQVSPSQTTTYTLTCNGAGGQATVQTSTDIVIRVFQFVGGALKEINPQ